MKHFSEQWLRFVTAFALVALLTGCKDEADAFNFATAENFQDVLECTSAGNVLSDFFIVRLKVGVDVAFKNILEVEVEGAPIIEFQTVAYTVKEREIFDVVPSFNSLLVSFADDETDALQLGWLSELDLSFTFFDMRSFSPRDLVLELRSRFYGAYSGISIDRRDGTVFLKTISIDRANIADYQCAKVDGLADFAMKLQNAIDSRNSKLADDFRKLEEKRAAILRDRTF